MVPNSLSVPTSKQCQDFVEAVVNGDDRDSSPALRNRFRKLYRDWFPNDLNDQNAVRIVLDAWKASPVMWWCPDSFASENPHDYFEWCVAVLRDMLRFIWLSEAIVARTWLQRLKADVFVFRRFGVLNEPWRERTLEACNWLERWLTNRKGSRLLICKNPDCTEMKYFIRGTKEPNQKYCSSPCSERGEELIRLQKRSQRQPARVLSPKGKEAISIGQRNRRRKENLRKGATGAAGNNQ